MKTAQQMREAMAQQQQAQEQINRNKAKVWCEGFAMMVIENATKDGHTRIDLCACEFDHKSITCVYDYLTKHGYTVRLNGSNLLTISW